VAEVCLGSFAFVKHDIELATGYPTAGKFQPERPSAFGDGSGPARE